MFFPRYYVVISDGHCRSVDYRLYENAPDARRAFESWRVENGRASWWPAHHEIISYDASTGVHPTLSLLSYKTFHGLSDSDLHAKSEPYEPYEVLKAASLYERRCLESADALRQYLLRKYRYYLFALIPLAAAIFIYAMLAGQFYVGFRPLFAPPREAECGVFLSLLLACFLGSVYYLHRQFDSFIGALLATGLFYLLAIGTVVPLVGTVFLCWFL